MIIIRQNLNRVMARWAFWVLLWLVPAHGEDYMEEALGSMFDGISSEIMEVYFQPFPEVPIHSVEPEEYPPEYEYKNPQDDRIPPFPSSPHLEDAWIGLDALANTPREEAFELILPSDGEEYESPVVTALPRRQHVSHSRGGERGKWGLVMNASVGLKEGHGRATAHLEKFIQPIPNVAGGGILIDGTVAPVCHDEPLCLITPDKEAYCVGAEGLWTRVHDQLSQISVSNNDLVGLDIQGTGYYFEMSKGLPTKAEQWKCINNDVQIKMIDTSGGNIWGLSANGTLYHRSTLYNVADQWKLIGDPGKPLFSISADSKDAFAVDVEGNAWHFDCKDGAPNGKWVDISSTKAGAFKSIQAYNDHVFGIAQESGQNPTGWFREIAAEGQGTWKEIDLKMGQHYLKGSMVPSLCGGHYGSPPGESFYVFGVNEAGELYYRFCYTYNLSAGEWHQLSQGKGRVWFPMGLPVDGDLLEGKVHTLARNTKVETLRTTYQYFNLSFKIAPWGTRLGWASVLHFTEPPNYPNNVRIPAVWFVPRTTVIAVSMDYENRKNIVCDTRTPLPMHKKTEVTIEVAKGYFKVFYNKIEKCKKVWVDAYAKQPEEDVAVYAGDPFYEPAAARIERLLYDNSTGPPPFDLMDLTQSEDMKPEKDKLLGTSPLQTYFHMSMSLTITGEMHGWHNLFHFTEDGGNIGPKRRIPAVWFHQGSRMHFRMSTQTSHNDGCDPGPPLPMNKKIEVDLLMVDGPSLIVKLDGKPVCYRIPAGSPIEGSQAAQVFASDVWHQPANVIIHNWTYSGVEELTFDEPLLPLPTVIQRYGFMGLVDTFENYHLQFEITPMGIYPHWSNIVHFTRLGNYGNYFRMPAIWFHPGSLKLHVRSGDLQQHNSGCDPWMQLKIGQKYKIEVMRKDRQIMVQIDDKTYCKANRGPPYPQMKRVQMWVGDPWHGAALAKISKIKYKEYDAEDAKGDVVKYIPKKAFKGLGVRRWTNGKRDTFEFKFVCGDGRQTGYTRSWHPGGGRSKMVNSFDLDCPGNGRIQGIQRRRWSNHRRDIYDYRLHCDTGSSPWVNDKHDYGGTYHSQLNTKCPGGAYVTKMEFRRYSDHRRDTYDIIMWCHNGRVVGQHDWKPRNSLHERDSQQC